MQTISHILYELLYRLSLRWLSYRCIQRAPCGWMVAKIITIIIIITIYQTTTIQIQTKYKANRRTIEPKQKQQSKKHRPSPRNVQNGKIQMRMMTGGQLAKHEEQQNCYHGRKMKSECMKGACKYEKSIWERTDQ